MKIVRTGAKIGDRGKAMEQMIREGAEEKKRKCFPFAFK